ncbi:MAG: hypothetical protein ACK4SU_04515 [Dictyoglomus sp.]
MYGFCDVLEYLLAGATLVQIGSANLRDPWIGKKLVEEAREYFKYERVNEIIGLAHKNY